VKLLFAAGLLFITACAGRPATPVQGAPDPAPDPAPARLIAIQIPGSIAGFAFVTRRDYEDPALGVQRRYANPVGLEADVYVYPGPDFAASCPAACGGCRALAGSASRAASGRLPIGSGCIFAGQSTLACHDLHWDSRSAPVP
jgi:hypothetical protein